MYWRQHLLIAAAGLLVAACGAEQPGTAASPAGTPTPAPALSPTPAPSSAPGAGAADAVSAVRALIFDPASPGPTSCRPATGPRFSESAGCPVTQRLEQRLKANPTSGSGGGADPICRCQNAASPVPVTLVTQGGASAVVRASFGFPGHPNDVQFSVSDLNGRWFVDDTYCADPTTSIYQTPVKPCAT